MPLKIPDKLPAIDILKRENIFVMDESKADKQDIRPLSIAILNLMPLKTETETDLKHPYPNRTEVCQAQKPSPEDCDT